MSRAPGVARLRFGARARPAAPARAALLSAYRVGFASTLDHLMIIGAVVAAIGSLCAYVLVRQADFVPSYASSEAAEKLEVAAT